VAKRRKSKDLVVASGDPEYFSFLGGISELLDQARRVVVRSVNSVLTATYWEVGRRLVEFEQGGKKRAVYGEELLKRLGQDLAAQHGRGFSERNLIRMRAFYLGWEISPTPSAKFQGRVRGSPFTDAADTNAGDLTPPSRPDFAAVAGAFSMPWSHYVRLLSVENQTARAFYEAEAVRGGWSVRQLDRQIGSQFYERVALSRNKAAMLRKGEAARPEDAVTVREEIRDPYVLEFLDLKDEYSETDLEEALVRHLETFLLELGVGFAFVARQKRIRIGNVWYRMDLVLFHRVLRALVVLDLKTGPFTHVDAGQMNLYLNYAREHLVMPGENEPIGLILCSEKDEAVVHYATGGIKAQVFASQYLTRLPDETTLREEIQRTRKTLEGRKESHSSQELPGE
jgi:predicted nuclease of restriction endonuclease-like (RecB) superfamily